MPSPCGEPVITLNRALDAMPAQKIFVLSISAFYATPAWPNPNDPPFVNAVAVVETMLPPQQLLTALHQIEADFGRVRTTPNAPRTLDIDLIDYHGHIMSGWPVLPHPRLHSRGFVLVPLADVAPDWVHPVSGQAVSSLIAALPQSEREAVRALTV